MWAYLGINEMKWISTRLKDMRDNLIQELKQFGLLEESFDPDSIESSRRLKSKD